QYPLQDDLPQYVADFALFCRDGRIAVLVTDEPPTEGELREAPPADYLLAANAWHVVYVTMAELEAAPASWAEHLVHLVARLGGPQNVTFDV
ncbi:MAG: hypothetical protein WHX53_00200, partial [Anaerolineae bacterium]